MKNLIKREQSKQVCFAESENSRTKFKRFIVILMAMMGVLTISAQTSIYDFKVKDDVWTGCYPTDDRVAEVSKVLKLPETIVTLCVIAVGHPAEQPTLKDKWKPENVSYNEFGGKAE